MRKIIRRICITGLFVITGVITAAVVNYAGESKINEAQAEKKELENKRKELNNTLSDLENDKQDIIAYIEKLDSKLNKVSADYEKTEEKIAQKKKAIKKLKKKIAQAEIDISNQYESMKKRIKYMYENGNSDYVDILLSSGSLSDMLNKSEYIEKIARYDSDLLDRFVESKNELDEKKASLEEKKEALETVAVELSEEKKALDKLEDKKKKEVQKYNENIEATQNAIIDNENELARQEMIIENELLRIAEEQRRREEEERRRREEEERRRREEQADNQSDDEDNEDGDDGYEPEPTYEPVEISSGGFGWPLAVLGKITSEFGQRTSPTAGASSNHQGIDIGAPTGTAILAANDGTVITASYSSGAGNYVMISHGNGVFTVYMHASSLAVKQGDVVKKGQTIARVGSTGISTGPHLHFGVSVNGSYVNPHNYI